MDAPWLVEARLYVGLAEVPGHDFNPVIREFWYSINAKWLWDQSGGDDGKAPWCGCFIAHCMKVAGIALPANPYRARAWLDWGNPIWSPDPRLDQPTYGCVAVFDGGPKRPGAGHVNLIVGEDKLGRLMGLGGNQGDAVSIAPFDRSRVLGYRWPRDAEDLFRFLPLPIVSSSGGSSTKEL